MLKRSALWSDPRVKPPTGAAEIDWSHPLAAGYASGVLCNEGGPVPVWMPRGGSPTVAGAPVAQPSPADLAIGFDGASDVLYWDTANFSSASMINATVVVGAIFPSSMTASGIFWGQGSSAVANDYFEMHTRQGANGDVTIIYRTASDGVGQATSAAATYNDLQLHAIGFTVDKTAALVRLYIDGKADNTGSIAGFGGPVMDRTSLGAQRRSSTTNFCSVKIVYVHQWLRALAPADHLWIAAEPYALLRPIVRRRYSVPPAAGFKPAWTETANQSVGFTQPAGFP